MKTTLLILWIALFTSSVEASIMKIAEYEQDDFNNADGRNIALNESRTGYPSINESDPGWGGGNYPWDLLDGIVVYEGWQHGLAFRRDNYGGGGPCGWRQATIDFGETVTFNKVRVWHYRDEDIPNTYKIEYWDGETWIELFYTDNGRDYITQIAPNNLVFATENVFDRVSGSKIRFVLNNCDITHGWLYEFEVYNTLEQKRLTVELPEGIDKDLYKNLPVEISNNTQLFSLTTGNSNSYHFHVPPGTYKAALKNKYNALLAEIDDIVILDNDTTVAFPSLASLYTIKLNIAGDHNLTDKPLTKWYDENDVFLQQGDSITGVAAGMMLKYHLELNEEWGKRYLIPPVAAYTVGEGDNTISIQLQEIPEVTIQGIIKNDEASIISDALVSITQLLNGKFATTKTIKSADDGKFSTVVANDSTVITISSPNYLSQTIRLSNFDEGTDLGTITLSQISGARIALNLTYTKSVLSGETQIVENSYSDYLNVDYSLFNRTKNEEITQFIVQYPELIILELVDPGDEIEITALSRTDIFNPVQSATILNSELLADIQLNIMQRGYIQAAFTTSENTENMGILYDTEGKIVKQFEYANDSFKSDGLSDGSYSLVSMGKSRFFNSVLNLSALPSTGLVQDVDYILQNLTITSGEITEIDVPAIPELNESLLYYTGDRTLFSVDKTSIIAGNYLTLRTEIDLKEEYADKVSNVKLIVDIPEQCNFESNSVIVGDAISDAYSFINNRLTIPLTNYSDIIRFCIVPYVKGTYAPNAFVQFDTDSETITQPIGAAVYTVENLSIFAPGVTAREQITVSGMTQARSEIKIYDGDALIGQTQALANGNWSMQCELLNPEDYSYHYIHAQVTTPDHLILQTETKPVKHDIAAIEVSKVTMINIAHPSNSLDLIEYITVYDFLNPAKKGSVYWYWPTYPDFTFTIEFTNNDPNLISDVTLHVLTTAGSTEALPAVYDTAKQVWIATGEFDAYRLPVNVSVSTTNPKKIAVTFEIIEETPLRSESEQQVKKSLKSTVDDFMDISNNYLNCKDDGILHIQAEVRRNQGRIRNLYSGAIAFATIEYYNTMNSISGPVETIIDFLFNLLTGSIVKSEEVSYIEVAEDIKRIICETLNQMKINPCRDGSCDSSPSLPWNKNTKASVVVEDPCEPLPSTTDSTCLPAIPVMDPSGYVYEAVPSNRLEGVMATIYYKTNEGDVIFWDAEDYGQENPMFTNENGEYGWDVPSGMWQVKYEKNGYQTTYSDWLPVPPPQLDVNMAKVQPAQPEVYKALGYESGIVIHFDKFMLPTLLSTENISVERNEASVSGAIELLNEEAGTGGSFASKVRFVPDAPFETTDEVILTVKREVRSYAGIEMAEDFIQRIAIQKEMTTISVPSVLELALHDKETVDVLVEPLEAAAGKKVRARSVSSSIATVTQEAVLDTDGKAVLQVTGELSGSTVLYVSVDDTDIKAEINVRVAMPEPMEQLPMLTASIPSGSTVEKNTTVTLSSEITDAAIYYTLDGSSPSATSGSEFTQPIAITEDVTIKAMAVKEGMLNSEIALFEYYVLEETDIADVEEETQEWMTIAPNPVHAGESLKIKLDIPYNSLPDFHIVIYSILGEKVYENHRLEPNMEVQILKQGYYLIRLSDISSMNYQTLKVMVIN